MNGKIKGKNDNDATITFTVTNWDILLDFTTDRISLGLVLPIKEVVLDAFRKLFNNNHHTENNVVRVEINGLLYSLSLVEPKFATHTKYSLQINSFSFWIDREAVEHLRYIFLGLRERSKEEKDNGLDTYTNCL